MSLNLIEKRSFVPGKHLYAGLIDPSLPEWSTFDADFLCYSVNIGP